MESEFSSKILELYNCNDWEKILDLNSNSDNSEALKFLWVWPSLKNLEFIKKVIQENECDGIISLGCGCGLLEWLIQQSTGINVIGYEVNPEWWQSKYSPPKFIELDYFNYPLEENALNPNFALLFCYFNNPTAFTDYVNNFRGNVVVIIGPGNGSGRHTDPQPFSANFGDINWRLDRYEEVKNSKDFIAVYVRNRF